MAVSRSALVLMDFQVGILQGRDGGAEVLAAAVRALRAARSARLQVVHVRVAFGEQDYASVPEHNKVFAAVRGAGRLAEGTPGAEIHPDLAPAPGDVVVTKTRVGAFSTTALDTHLRGRGIDTLVLGGVSTSGVVLSTVRDAADRDYRLVVLSDCCLDVPEVHSLLVSQVFPRQADVVDLAAFEAGLRPGSFPAARHVVEPGR
jgi:nicotinamidase-related amidase